MAVSIEQALRDRPGAGNRGRLRQWKAGESLKFEIQPAANPASTGARGKGCGPGLWADFSPITWLSSAIIRRRAGMTHASNAAPNFPLDPALAVLR